LPTAQGVLLAQPMEEVKHSKEVRIALSEILAGWKNNNAPAAY
jgi:hypothetical protein